MASELLPCPFCGGKAYMKRVRDRHPNDGEWDACCEDCGATIQEGYTEDAAIRDWNTRPAPAATDTGLVRYDLSMFGNGIVEMGGGAYVRADKAEEILAAERAESERLRTYILRAEKAEAKLTAAQKALEPFADHAKERAVDAPEWRDTDTVQIVVTIGDLRAARAVLGGKPS